MLKRKTSGLIRLLPPLRSKTTIQCPVASCTTELTRGTARTHFKAVHRFLARKHEVKGKSIFRCPFDGCAVETSDYPSHVEKEHIAKQTKRGWEDKIRDPRTGKVVHRDQVQG